MFVMVFVVETITIFRDGFILFHFIFSVGTYAYNSYTVV